MVPRQWADNNWFDSSVRWLDVLERVRMRILSYTRPVRDARTCFGAVIRCDGRDFVQRRIRFFNIFEHNLTYYTLQQLKEGDTYLDIGANVGYYTLLASMCVGSRGHVIAVEADPVTYGCLLRNVERNQCHNVVAHNVAATAGSCMVSINRKDRYNSGNNAIVPASPDRVGIAHVSGMPLEEIAGQDLSRIRFIKVDIEGSEEPILSAILSIRSRLRDDLIVASEVSPKSADYVARFSEAGFRAYAMQNIYTIDYYLVRSYLRGFGEHATVHKIPVTKYDPKYSDYVFERA